jgi:hypothetical protein
MRKSRTEPVKTNFQPIPLARFRSVDGHRLFQLAFDHIAPQIEVALGEPDEQRLKRLPKSVQAVYWLWCFQAEAGGGGLEVFTLNNLGTRTREVHSALELVGATELLRRLEAAIPLARQSHAEFTLLPDQSWFEKWPTVVEFPTLRSVDKGIYPLIRALSSLVADFMRRHELEFAAE